VTTRTTNKVLLVGGRRLADDAVRALIGDDTVDGPASDRAAALERLVVSLRHAGCDAELVSAESVDAEPPSPDDDQARLLLDTIGEGVCLADRHGRVLWSNRFFRGLDAASRKEIGVCLCEARNWFDDHGPAQQTAIVSLTAGDARIKSDVCRFEVESSESEVIYEVEITVARTRGDDDPEAGRVERMAVVVRDITAARRSMRKLDAIDRAGLELVRLDAKSVREKNTYQRLELLEEKIVRLMHDVLEYDHFAIFVIDESRQKLELVISAGLPQEIHNLDLSPEHEGSGISGYVAITGKSYICRDATSDDRFIPGLAGAQSSCTVPLRMHDRVIGIMDVESQHASAFTSDDLQFLEIFARYLAIALHMLDLLVVERSQTNLSVSGRVGGELEEPLEDIVNEIDALGETIVDPTKAGHLKRIREDVDAIRSRLASVAEGPSSLLGVDRALAEHRDDPLLAGRRALVADDVQKICKIIEAVLGARGCESVVVHNGQDAIDVLTRAAEGGEGFDIVISDIRMPDRNGYEVFSAAQKNHPGTPVILMTGFGYDPHHSIVRASQEGMSCVLFKPFDIEQLIQEIHKALAPAE